MPTPPPVRTTGQPWGNRAPEPGARFFLTLPSQGGNPWLGIPRTRNICLTAFRAWHGEHDGRVLIACLMPDHAHLVIEAGRLHNLPQLVDRWKSTIRREAGYAETFEREFREHRIGGDENLEDYALYTFLHPYKAGLVRRDQTWAGTWLPDPAVFTFASLLNVKGGPQEEWMEWPASRFAALSHGE